MEKAIKTLHEIHYSSFDIHQKVEQVRKDLGAKTNPLVKLHSLTGETFLKGRKITDQQAIEWNAKYKKALKELFQVISDFAETVEVFEKYENAHNTGIQLGIHYGGKKLKADNENVMKYLNASNEEIKPRISGRAARNRAN